MKKRIRLNVNDRKQTVVLMALWRYGTQPIIETNNASIFEIDDKILKKILTFILK